MSTNYRFRIADSYTPETLPMERLAEYMAALAKLLGEPQGVHFDDVKAGSAVLVAKVDTPARPKVRERVYMLRNGNAPLEVIKAFNELDDLLRKDNATGELTSDDGGVVIPFPGREKPQLLTFGPFKQDGSLEGQVVRIGGTDETVPVHLRDGAIIHIGQTTPDTARQIAPHLYGPTLRLHGTGTWFRDGDGGWHLKSFKISSFEVLDDADLDKVVGALRRVKGNTWNEVPDPVRALLEERHGRGGTG
ncbi:hypothetical protein [Mesorhizobium salmacidum]|uniref:Uncharacterized protein n=1 Tax=Mesorhizobium salmacidum TaxID=3015171 RepID=A0ABU8KTV7_9HYPH